MSQGLRVGGRLEEVEQGKRCDEQHWQQKLKVARALRKVKKIFV